jgi:transposase
LRGLIISAGGAAVQDPTNSLFQLALGLEPPWQVELLEFSAERHRLDIRLGFPRGAHFPCPECGAGDCPVHDVIEKEWRHLNFFQHEAYLQARVPRIRCQQHGVRQVSVPWAREGSGFTLLFEALAMLLMREMPVKAAARLVGEQDTRLWRMLLYYVELGRSREDFSEVAQVGVDETSHRRGHDYVSVFVDLDRAKAIFATPTREKKVIAEFKADLEAHGGKAEKVANFSADLWQPYREGIQENFANARLTIDRYHILQLLNRAVDEVRRREQRSSPGLKQTRYIWLKKQSNLTARQREDLPYLRRRHRRTARAYELKLEFEDLWQLPADQATSYLEDWCNRVYRTRGLDPIKDFVDTIDVHWDDVLRWFQTRITNGVLEAINSLVQAAKRRARGYRTDKHYIAMIYMIAGKLSFGLPT